MEFLINKWIQETLLEHERAKQNQNLYLMEQMRLLKKSLINMRDNLLKTL
jgi:hypothetical protein